MTHKIEDNQPSNRSIIPAMLVGTGPIHVIVVHGWMGGSQLFHPFVPCIDPTKFTYAFFDCRGYGHRRDEAGPSSMKDTAQEVTELADSLGWQVFHVMGHSMGGMVAQRLLVDSPERIKSAVLLATVPANGARIDQARRTLLLSSICEPTARRELIDINTGRVRDQVWLDGLLSASLESTSQKGMSVFLTMWADTDFQQELTDTSIPVLAIVGALDPGTTESRIRKTIFKWFSNAQLVSMDDVGHYAMQEAPEALERIVTPFFQAFECDS